MTGNFEMWKVRTRAVNVKSTTEKIFIGPESDRKFVITWDAKTFLEMGDDKVYFLIQGAMKNISNNILKKPDARYEFAFNTVTADGGPMDTMDFMVGEKFDRVIELLK